MVLERYATADPWDDPDIRYTVLNGRWFDLLMCKYVDEKEGTHD